MKLSQKGEYGLRAVLVLAREYKDDDSVVRIQEISKKQNIPKRFLEQILNDLRVAGIVESRRGISGGYRLRRSPRRITLAEVIRYLEGPLAPVGCVSERFYEKCSCPDESRCAVRSVMKEVRDAIVGVLDGVTLADLAERSAKLEAEPAGALDFTI
jgi:Rrf2 family protein